MSNVNSSKVNFDNMAFLTSENQLSPSTRVLGRHTKNSKATFGKKACLKPENNASHVTQIVIGESNISITVSKVPGIKVSGHTRVDFDAKRKKDSYKKLNKMLEEG